MRPEHWLYTIPLRSRSLFRWAQADQELDEELRDHLERKIEEYVAQGMTQEEAHRRARLDLGGMEQTKEKCRDTRRVIGFKISFRICALVCGCYANPQDSLAWRFSPSRLALAQRPQYSVLLILSCCDPFLIEIPIGSSGFGTRSHPGE